MENKKGEILARYVNFIYFGGIILLFFDLVCPEKKLENVFIIFAKFSILEYFRQKNYF